MAGGVLMSIACNHNNHGNCNRPDRHCHCKCHPWVTPEPKTLLHTYREEAHQAVKQFDLKPSPETASNAIAALQLFIGVHSA